jgi:hypothetical protein
MNRLTIRLPNNLGCVPAEGIGWQEISDRLAAYEDTGLEPEEIAELTKSLLVGMNKRNRAMELLQAESEGRLIVRPGTVYQTDGVNIYESAVRKIIYDTGHFAFDDDAIGCSVFLTREEAEAALGGDGDA